MMKKELKYRGQRQFLSLLLAFVIVFTSARFSTINARAMSISNFSKEGNYYRVCVNSGINVCRLKLSSTIPIQYRNELPAYIRNYSTIWFHWYSSNGHTPIQEIYMNGSNSVILYLQVSGLDENFLSTSIISRLIEEEQHYDKFTAQEPTCTKNGYREHRCTRCGFLIHSQTIPALGHASNNVWVTGANATCTTNGEKHTNCSRCGVNMNSTSIPALGHNSNNTWITTKNPTCTENGSKHTNCTRCNANMNVTAIPKLGHLDNQQWTIDSEATCTTNGRKHTNCSRCNTILNANTLIPALGHEMDEGVVTTYPTVYESGIRTHHCGRCDYEETSVEPQYHFNIYVGENRIKKIAKGSTLLFEHTTQDADELPFVSKDNELNCN